MVALTFDAHQSFTGASTGTPPLSTAERVEQLDQADAVIRRLSGSTTKPWFRAPYGDDDESVNADLGAHGYFYNVRWTVDSLGWDGASAAKVIERCLDEARPGAIYLLHVGSESLDGVALPRIIEGVAELGYGFQTVRQLLA